MIYAQIFSQVFPNRTLPKVAGAACCSQFALTREKVKERPKRDYVRYREILQDPQSETFITGRAFEYLWHSESQSKWKESYAVEVQANTDAPSSQSSWASRMSTVLRRVIAFVKCTDFATSIAATWSAKADTSCRHTTSPCLRTGRTLDRDNTVIRKTAGGMKRDDDMTDFLSDRIPTPMDRTCVREF